MATGGPRPNPREPSIFPQSSQAATTPIPRNGRKRDVGFVGELGNVLGNWLHQVRTSPVGQRAWWATGVPALVETGEYVAGNIGRMAEDVGTAKEFLFGGPPPPPVNVSGGPDDRGQAAAQRLLQQSAQIMPQFEAIQALEGAPLDASSKIAVEQLRATLEQQAADLQTQLEAAQTNLAMQNQFFNAYETAAFGEQGLIPGVDPLEAGRLNTALDTGGEKTGLQPEVLEAINSIMGSDLSGDAKMQRVDFILDQQGVQQEARVGINDFTQNLADIENLEESTDVELLINQGLEPGYVQPSFGLDLSADPLLRSVSTIMPFVDNVFDQAGVVLSEDELGLVSEFVAGIGPTPDFANPAIANQIDTISQQFGVDPTALQDALKNGANAAAGREDMWNNAVTKSRLEPGSEELAIAIFQTALDKGLPEEMALLIAESVQLHALIKAKSDGKAGSTRGGSQMGIGGLSEEAYTALAYDVKATKGNMQMEISALIDYIVQNFGGDPRQALAYYYGTGEWGN